MSLQITASMIAQYMHCRRQGRLFYHNLKSEHTSETVKIGKIYHELRYDENDDNVEVELEGIKIDKLSSEYVEEFKKADTDFESVEMQVLFYLRKLKNIGVKKDGIIKYKENRNNKKVLLTEENEQKLLDVLKDIEYTLSQNHIPEKLLNTNGNPHKKCKGCSYYEFCWI